MLSPIYTSKEIGDPIAAELLRLGITPSKPLRKIRGIDLSAEEYGTYQTKSGQLAKTLLGKLIASPQWGELSEDQKADLIDDVMRKSRDLGRALTMKEHRDLLLRIAGQK